MSLPIKVGLNIVWVQPSHVAEFARCAEDLGFESVWSGEHVCLPARPDWWHNYPAAQAAAARGEAFSEEMISFRPESEFLDPMVVLSHVAAVTSTIRLGIGIYLLALRDPVLVGRTIASLDVLSKGRLDLAIGLGWTADEYRFTNNVWETRGRRLDEMIRCLRVLFDESRPEFHGEFFDFPEIGFQPKPVQKPRLPIHVGGGSAPAVRRAAQLGDGWYGMNDPSFYPLLREELKKAGREGEPFQLSLIDLGSDLSQSRIDEMVADGVERIVVTPWPGKKVAEVGREGLADIERYAKRIGLSR
jgi:probable F420-dependent oxidoreductase